MKFDSVNAIQLMRFFSRKQALNEGSSFHHQLREFVFPTAAMCKRSETRVVLDFCHLLTRPGPSAVKKIVLDLGVKPEDLRALINCRNRNAIILEFYSVAVAANTVARPLTYQGKKIPVYIDDETIEVRVHDLPLSVSNETIVQTMSQFGDILTINQEHWRNYFPGVLNGVRLLKMRNKSIQSVPKYIMIGNFTATIIYKGQKAACRLTGKKKTSNKTCRPKHKVNATEASNNSQENNNNISKNDVSCSNNNKTTNNNNNRSNKNNNNLEEQQKDDSNPDNNNNNEISDPDEEGFELVQSKRQRKSLKRQHSQEQDSEPKLCGYQKAFFFMKKWMEAVQTEKEAVDDVSKQHADRMKKLFKEKFEKCRFKLNDEEFKKLGKKMIELLDHEDFGIDLLGLM